MEEWVSMLMGKGKEATALWEISSPPHVVAGSKAIMERGMMWRHVLRGQWRGLKQGGPH